MDILKVMDEGKPLMFEGEIGLNYFINSPYGPSEERFEACKKFINSEIDLNTMTENEIFQYFNKANTGLKQNQYAEPNWLAEDAM
jgi:hypothetical protein